MLNTTPGEQVLSMPDIVIIIYYNYVITWKIKNCTMCAFDSLISVALSIILSNVFFTLPLRLARLVVKMIEITCRTQYIKLHVLPIVYS